MRCNGELESDAATIGRSRPRVTPSRADDTTVSENHRYIRHRRAEWRYRMTWRKSFMGRIGHGSMGQLDNSLHARVSPERAVRSVVTLGSRL